LSQKLQNATFRFFDQICLGRAPKSLPKSKRDFAVNPSKAKPKDLFCRLIKFHSANI